MCTRPGAGRRLEIVAEIPCASSASRMFLQRSSELHTTQTARFCWTKPAMSAAAHIKGAAKGIHLVDRKADKRLGGEFGDRIEESIQPYERALGQRAAQRREVQGKAVRLLGQLAALGQGGQIAGQAQDVAAHRLAQARRVVDRKMVSAGR